MTDTHDSTSNTPKLGDTFWKNIYKNLYPGADFSWAVPIKHVITDIKKTVNATYYEATGSKEENILYRYTLSPEDGSYPDQANQYPFHGYSSYDQIKSDCDNDNLTSYYSIDKQIVDLINQKALLKKALQEQGLLPSDPPAGTIDAPTEAL